MRRILATCLGGLSLLGPSHLSAQVLDDWYILHSSEAFDYLVTERGFGKRDSTEQGPRVLRVTASRMLVRYVDDTRVAIVRDRTARGMDSSGYDSFASSTYLLDVRSCDGQAQVSVVEITDYDSRGQVLSRTRPESRWATAVAQWDDAATARLIDWACSKYATHLTSANIRVRDIERVVLYELTR